ncbi:MAG TPA: L,D-transpeptidase/peptidoglycan binding protein [Solirubrobacterales bacterium]|jgi:lipoprotein-anchoring transpeptidase ErfK/SrfK|nr:L,D-transpeptidase/peptidoglycan binding protein [Solirubrobacterales bacterium]
MGRKTQIAVAAGVAILVLFALGAFAYDSSQKDQIADGVTVGGVDVGGMDEAEAKQEVRRQLLGPLRHSLRVGYDGHSWELRGKSLKVHAEIDAAVEKALAESRDGGLPTRLVRYVTGGNVDKQVAADVTYSQPAINRFVRRVAHAVDREAEDATIEPTADSLEVVAAKNGRKLRDKLLTRQLEAAVLNAGADHAIKARTHSTVPEVTTKEVASAYPSYLTLDRSTFTLRLWKDLKLAKTYTVAVGQEGLETPEGLYHIEEKQENPSWHVPDSAWAGDLAGQVIPPGPEDPIKARWMAIFEGAGIHGTEETESLGSAASHGCVRMSIPDVIELYPQVEVGTPIFIG